MAKTIQVPLPPMAVKPVAHAPVVPDTAVVLAAGAEDKAVVLTRRFLRSAIDESGWKHDAVASALDIDGPYLSKMLAGEKLITLRHLDALPNEIEARYYQRRAEACGFIVVMPVSGEEALRHLVGGLVGVLQGKKVA